MRWVIMFSPLITVLLMLGTSMLLFRKKKR
jgi:LPXTG-motif cell wall-anchored protein